MKADEKVRHGGKMRQWLLTDITACHENGWREEPCPPKEGASQAFTLLELLVTIAIVSMLAALLLTTVSAAKANARKIHCNSNLGQWAKAFLMYQVDHELIPREEGHRLDGTVEADAWSTVFHASTADVWYNALPNELSYTPARKYAGTRNGIREFYRDKLFHCPSAKFPIGAENSQTAFFSLAMNSKLIQPPLGESLKGPEYSIPYAAIQNPSDTPVFIDERVSRSEEKVHPYQVDTSLGQPSASANRFAPRHRKGGNIAFCDGHVDWFPGHTVVETRPGWRAGYAIYPGGQINWCANPADPPNQSD